ncbi:unnamed protein product [Pseudo-nitzschia multistriata]|uniref:Uncharacterized protein n=1 Tax=Pseudo-nitzschia multistriata TaxID=183589 RepID=A0A448ZJ44_9STRA|nr:unnamed protein product [Pseudo-nitzschia multistriata]
MTACTKIDLLKFIVVTFAAFIWKAEADECSQSEFATTTSCDNFLEEFRLLIESGNLSLARRKALEAMHDRTSNRCSENQISTFYVASFQGTYDAIGNDFLTKIQESVSTKNSSYIRAKSDSPNCMKLHIDWNDVNPIEFWDRHCSLLPVRETVPTLSSPSFAEIPRFQYSSQTPCCEFCAGSSTYLRLPALKEPAIRLNIQHHKNWDQKGKRSATAESVRTVFDLEQDGYLRPFDVAGILWPTGYLLSLCLGDIFRCPIPELHNLVLDYHSEIRSKEALNANEKCLNHSPLGVELGAGIGAASVVLAKSLKSMGFPSSSYHAKCKPWVVATDLAPHALALAIANGKRNLVDLSVSLVDHFNQSSVKEMKSKYFFQEVKKTASMYEKEEQNYARSIGFPLVFGSSLQGLFQDTDKKDCALWKSLEALIDMNNPNALAILVHNRADPLRLPNDANFSFRLVRRISGSHEVFGNMKTRNGDTSEFEIYVFQRQITRHSKARSLPTSIGSEEL